MKRLGLSSQPAAVVAAILLSCLLDCDFVIYYAQICISFSII